ncbi:MCP four helix bundle domain-containing protein, partial [Puerhibacterium sp. TATVAM-FAB25]|uniref:MCP four helix bundle domain-containing protein n=1 Tax=Puerhibacterium sp. TATVAM-FAB25 TaxID=3093699 RepID=UPI00397B6851
MTTVLPPAPTTTARTTVAPPAPPPAPVPYSAHAPAPRRRRLGDLPVAVRIGAAIAVPVVAMVAVAGVGGVRTSTLAEEIQSLGTDVVAPQSYLNEAQRTFQASRARVLEYGMVEPGERAALEQERAEKDAATEASIAAYEPYVLDDAAYAAFVDAFDRYQAAADAVQQQADAGAIAYNDAYRAQVLDLTTEVLDALQALVDSASARADADIDAASALASSTVRTVVLVAAVGALAGAGLAVVIVRRLRRGIATVQHSVDAMATGDLTVTADIDTQDELGRMAASLRTAQSSLRATLAD